MKKINNIVIVGNGLDRHHGLKTLYTDFRDNCMNKSLLNKLKECAKDLDVEYGYKTWYDLEETYRLLIIRLTKQIENKGGFSQQNLPKYEHSIREINELFHQIMHELQKYLAQISLKNDCYKIDKSVLNILESADKILNFNYTRTLEDLYKISDEKIIHVHGELDTFPILGQSNYFDNENEIHGMANLAQYISHNSKNIVTINAQTGKFTEANGNQKITQPIDTPDFGDKFRQRIFLMQKEQKCSQLFLPYSIQQKIYACPFDEFNFDNFLLKNKLAIEFEKNIQISIIGHGLMSDKDLLSKIGMKSNKLVNIFQRPSGKDLSLMSEVFKVFDVGNENLIVTDYEWD